jgi:CBS domain-containing protein
MPTARELMTKEVLTISPDTIVQQAAELMAERCVGSLIITKDNRPKGIITECDLLTKILATKRHPTSVTVSETMSSPLITVRPVD